MTSVANNYSFGDVFSKQVKALGMDGDVLLVLSTSGDSENLVSAVDTARSQGIYTAGFLGGDGGKLAKLVDLALVAKSRISPRIQEAHILAGHTLCHLVDYLLFERHLSNES
jgi:D-sedoheptulose 7-phosphate isomerase